MVSGWLCKDCRKTFKSIETFNKHKCHPPKGNCEKKVDGDCSNPLCRYASFPNQDGAYDLGIPYCSKPNSFDRIYPSQPLDNKNVGGKK